MISLFSHYWRALIIYGNQRNHLVSNCNNMNITSGRSYSNQNVSISDCYFIRFQPFSGRGGVICSLLSSTSIFVNQTMFVNCSCSETGGAVDIEVQSCYFVRICAFRCRAHMLGHFIKTSISGNQQIESSSITSCSYDLHGTSPLYMIGGDQNYHLINSSINHVNYMTGLQITNPKTFQNSFCTFSNGKALTSGCIQLQNGEASIRYSNIVGNNVPNGGSIILVENGNHKMENCIFSENDMILFRIYSGSLMISHCIISHSGSFSFATSVITDNNNTMSLGRTYQISFFSSQYCKTDFSLHPQTPEFTLKNTEECSIEPTLEYPEQTKPRTYDLKCSFPLSNRNTLTSVFAFSILIG